MGQPLTKMLPKFPMKYYLLQAAVQYLMMCVRHCFPASLLDCTAHSPHITLLDCELKSIILIAQQRASFTSDSLLLS